MAAAPIGQALLALDDWPVRDLGSARDKDAALVRELGVSPFDQREDFTCYCQAGSIISSMASPRTVLRPFASTTFRSSSSRDCRPMGGPTGRRAGRLHQSDRCGGMLVEQRRVTELGRVVGDLRDFRPFCTIRLHSLPTPQIWSLTFV
jgi:hypothetical protein